VAVGAGGTGAVGRGAGGVAVVGLVRVVGLLRVVGLVGGVGATVPISTDAAARATGDAAGRATGDAAGRATGDAAGRATGDVAGRATGVAAGPARWRGARDRFPGADGLGATGANRPAGETGAAGSEPSEDRSSGMMPVGASAPDGDGRQRGCSVSTMAPPSGSDHAARR
jgi:hypothetical protein